MKLEQVEVVLEPLAEGLRVQAALAEEEMQERLAEITMVLLQQSILVRAVAGHLLKPLTLELAVQVALVS
jgi:hypothetical protein